VAKSFFPFFPFSLRKNIIHSQSEESEKRNLGKVHPRSRLLLPFLFPFLFTIIRMRDADGNFAICATWTVPRISLFPFPLSSFLLNWRSEPISLARTDEAANSPMRSVFFFFLLLSPFLRRKRDRNKCRIGYKSNKRVRDYPEVIPLFHPSLPSFPFSQRCARRD